MDPRLESINQALRYIEGHIRKDVSIAEIAEHCGYSLYHFIRLFNTYAHQTPYDYLIRRRTSEAIKDLSNNDRAIIDIAFDYCFKTPESFSRAFKRVFGILPSAFRAGQPFVDSLPIPPRTREDLQFAQLDNFVQPELITADQITLAGVSHNAEYIPQNNFTSEMEEVLQLIASNNQNRSTRYYLVSSYQEDPFKPRHRFLGFNVNNTEYPPPISIQHIPAGTFVRLACAELDQGLALRYLFYSWLPRSRMVRNGSYYFEYMITGKRKLSRTIFFPVSSS